MVIVRGIPIDDAVGKVVSIAPERVGVGISFVPLPLSILLSERAVEKE